MDIQKKQPCRKRNGKEVSFDFKLSVIDEINNGRISANYASKKYNISRSTIAYRIKKRSAFHAKSKAMSKDEERSRIATSSCNQAGNHPQALCASATALHKKWAEMRSLRSCTTKNYSFLTLNDFIRHRF
jgi:hypothetical protein